MLIHTLGYIDAVTKRLVQKQLTWSILLPDKSDFKDRNDVDINELLALLALTANVSFLQNAGLHVKTT